MRQWSPFQLLVPAGTLQAAPVSGNWRPYPAYVHAFKIVIPTGHNGLTGVRIVYQGTPVVPFDLNLWLVGSGGSFDVPFGDDVLGNGLVVQGYNTDVWAHTFYLYADVDPYYRQIPPSAVSSPRKTPVSGLAAAAIGGLASSGGGP